MPDVSGSSGFNIESFVNNVSADLAKGDIEDKRVTKARIRVNSDKIEAKREDRIKNLIDQIKGVSTGGACFKFWRAVFKVIDFLAKPLSLLTLNQLKLDLSKTLDMLKKTKDEKALMGLRINGQDILKSIQNFKKLLGDDMERLKTQDQKSAKETERILHILDEIDTTYRATTNI